MRRDVAQAEDFAKRGLRTTQDPLGALHFDPDDNQVRKDVAVKKAVDRLNSQKVTSYADVATIVGVPQNVYLDYIRNEIDTEQNFLQLPWTILLLLSFTVLSMGLLQQDVEFALQEAYDRDIEENANFAWSGAFGHRGLHNVSSIPQFWSWARLGLLPTLVQPAWVYSEPNPVALGPNVPSSNLSALPQSWLFRDYRKAAPMPNDYLHFSKLVGGIRLRQIAADVDDCTLPSLVDPVRFAAWLGKPCTPSSIGALSPERPSAQQFNGFSRTQYILPGVDTLPEMQRTLLDMEDGCNYAHSIGDLSTCLCDWCKQQPRQPWLDEQTARVEVSYVVFNAQYGLYTYVSINFLLNRGGHVYRFTDMISCFQDPLRTSMGNSIPTAIAIAIWAVLQVKLLIDEIRDAIRTVRSSKHGIWRGLLRDYLRFWNLVDWLSMIVAGMAVFFWLNVRTQVDAVNSLMPATVRATMYPTGQAVGERRAAYKPTAEAWFTAAEQMSLANSACTVTIILYPLVIMLRLFKSFQAQPRLAIVTETIKTAIPELAHFFIVALCMFGCLFVNSIVFFGQDLEAFSTIPRAFHWCLAAVLGHFDWRSLKEVGYVNAASWLWIFSIVMSLISLNMLLAIVLDSYSLEKEKASELKTLLEQLGEVVELLFSRKPAHRSDIWEELVAVRACFLTIRCAKQYLGFISERLLRAKELLDPGRSTGGDAVPEDDAPLEPEKAGQLSKLLYHAHHKLLELNRILEGGCPQVALTGAEREKVMQLRLQRPRSLAEGLRLLAEAERQRAAAADRLKAADAEGTLPKEVDAQALTRWLRSVRERAALRAKGGTGAASNPLSRSQSASSALLKTRSAEIPAAMCELIAEIEASEKIRVVIAGIGISSRTMGTAHATSDYDIKCIFVQPRSSYFGLKSSATTFKHHFAAAVGGLDVEISGWEARHALQLLSEDNPTVLGLLLSPVIYVGEEWRNRLREVAEKTSNRQRLMHHWYNHARRNYQSYILNNDTPLRKRYVHVLRPLLSIAWQNEHGTACFPPATLAELLAKVEALGRLSVEEVATVKTLIERVEELPEALPREPNLDALLARLLESERPVGTKPPVPTSDVWHHLCVELINAEAPW